MLEFLKITKADFNIGYKTAILFSVLIFIGTIARFWNLFNLGSYYDTIATQYLWGKYQFENGVFEFWKNYPGQFDYMPGAYFIDYVVYAVSSLFGGTEQQFVTVLKIFNWFWDMVWVFLVYFSAKAFNRSNRFSLLIASLAYAMPSVWIVTAAWGQMDSFVGVLAIGAVYSYYLSGKDFLNRKKRIFLWFLSAFLIVFGYLVKPTAAVVVPVIFLLIFQRKDWKFTVPLFLNFIVVWGMFFALPLSANLERVHKILLIPFQDGSAHSQGASLWYLLNFNGTASEIILGFEKYGLTISFVSRLLILFITAVIVFKYFNLAEGFKQKLFLRPLNWIIEIFTKIFRKEISFQFLTAFTLIFTFSAFLFGTRMHSRYLIVSIMVSFVYLAVHKSKNSLNLFFLLMLMHVAFFLNQIWLINTKESYLIGVAMIRYLFNVNLISLAAVIYLVSFTGLYFYILNSLNLSKKVIK